MKKNLIYEILPVYNEEINSLVIRHKSDILRVLLRCCKIIINQKPVNKIDPDKNYLILKISKMSRVFIFDDNRIYSINFPFSLYENKEGSLFLKIPEISDLNISNLILDALIYILKEFKFCQNGLYDLLDLISKYQYFEEIDEDISIYDNSANRIINMEEFLEKILLNLLCIEDGYLRCDHDTNNFKKDRPHLHPIDHIDLFYSSNPTFKIGLKKKYSVAIISDMVDITTDCMYLHET